MEKIINVVCLLIVGMLSSCAVSQSIQYDNLTGSLDFKGNKSVSIATLDMRTQVVDSTRNPDFVGYMRSGVGIAYPAGTKSKNSLAEDFSSSISKTLASKGFKTKVLPTSLLESSEKIVAKLIDTESDRLLFVTLKNWVTDGYGVISIQFDVNISVYDTKGNVLADKNFSEWNKAIGGNAFMGPGNYKIYIPEYVKLQIATMLNQSDIQQALRD
jgi:hypothetical protein